MDIKNAWNDLTAEKKQQYIKYAAIGGVIAIATASYYGSGEAEKRAEPVTKKVVKELNLGRDLLKDDIQEKVSQDLIEQNRQLEDFEQRLSSSEEISEIVSQELERLQAEGVKVYNEHDNVNHASADTSSSYPSPPTGGYNSVPAYNSMGNASQVEIKPEVIGGLGHSQGEPPKEVNDIAQKKNPKSYYLAPSWMKAKTLHGIRALTTQGALANPEPIMIRIQAPAVLPNSLRTHLEGCYVMGNASGSLAKERIEIQIVNLSCLSDDGSAIIDQEVLGYVVDSDGNKDINANIVTKMDQHVWRSFLAGTAAGLGDGFSQSTSQSQITAAGVVNTFSAKDVGKKAIGGGLSTGLEDVSDLLLDLAKQTSPVAESGGAKDIFVIIQKGVKLIIKERVTNE